MEPSPESGGDEPPPSAPEPDTGRSGRAPLVVALALLLVGVGVAVALVVGGDDSDNTASPTSTTAVTTTIAAPTTSGGATAPAAVDPVTGLPTGRFTIVGRQIVDPDGNVFVPMGANVAVRQGGFEEGYAFNWNGTATGRVADVKAWGWNTVRATLVCDLDGTGPTVDELNAGIDAFIEEYTRQRVVVMVECHDITGDNLGPTDPKVQALFPFWDRLATKWKDNPYVWFNFYNEPQGTTTAAGVDNWLDLQRGTRSVASEPSLRRASSSPTSPAPPRASAPSPATIPSPDSATASATCSTAGIPTAPSATTTSSARPTTGTTRRRVSPTIARCSSSSTTTTSRWSSARSATH
ncbi:MAG: cellulase family glycosylhydrolase [Microthrixaceae bacterium]